MDHKFRQAGSFTLIEMLVVIAIIGILSSLLLPSLNKAVNTAKMVSCSNQLKQIGMVMNMYVNDNNGWLPSADGPVWVVSDPAYKTWLWNYLPEKEGLKELVRCPALNEGLWYGHGNYGISSHWFRFIPWNKPYHKLSEVQKPSKTLFITDINTTSANILASTRIIIASVYAGGAYPENDKNIDYRHNDFVNCLWGDGHMAGEKDLFAADAAKTYWCGK